MTFRSQLSILALAAAVLAAPIAIAQAPGTPAPDTAPAPVPVPQFDVISVKPDKTANGMTRVRFSPNGLDVENVTVHMLLLESYRLNEDQLFGEPNWANTDRFDIQAKVAGPDVVAFSKLPVDQRWSMFRQVLTEQFHLTNHTETHLLPVYVLTVAKGGIKFKQHVPDPAHPERENGSGGRGRMVALGSTVDLFLFSLSQNLGRTLVDKTGLTGRYDFELHWTPDDASALPPRAADGSQPSAPPPSSDSGPSIFTAIQEQLGLKLESAKGPVPVLVIDHIELPSAN